MAGARCVSRLAIRRARPLAQRIEQRIPQDRNCGAREAKSPEQGVSRNNFGAKATSRRRTLSRRRDVDGVSAAVDLRRLSSRPLVPRLPTVRSPYVSALPFWRGLRARVVTPPRAVRVSRPSMQHAIVQVTPHRRGVCRMRRPAWRPRAFVPMQCRLSAVADRRRRAWPSTVRLQWPASWTGRRACPRGCGPSPRGRTRQPAWWAPCLAACPSSLARASSCPAWQCSVIQRDFDWTNARASRSPGLRARR